MEDRGQLREGRRQMIDGRWQKEEDGDTEGGVNKVEDKKWLIEDN